MPEFNKRVSFRGLARAEKAFGAYVKQRLASERSTDVLVKSVRDLERQAGITRRELEREVRRG